MAKLTTRSGKLFQPSASKLSTSLDCCCDGEAGPGGSYIDCTDCAGGEADIESVLVSVEGFQDLLWNLANTTYAWPLIYEDGSVHRFGPETCLCSALDGSYACSFVEGSAGPFGGCLWQAVQHFSFLKIDPADTYNAGTGNCSETQPRVITCDAISEAEYGAFLAAIPASYSYGPYPGPDPDYECYPDTFPASSATYASGSEGVMKVTVSFCFRAEHVGGGVYNRFACVRVFHEIYMYTGGYKDYWTQTFHFEKSIADGVECEDGFVSGDYEANLGYWSRNTGYQEHLYSYIAGPMCNWSEQSLGGATPWFLDNWELVSASVAAI